jgi:hypothetical protein
MGENLLLRRDLAYIIRPESTGHFPELNVIIIHGIRTKVTILQKEASIQNLPSWGPCQLIGCYM